MTKWIGVICTLLVFGSPVLAEEIEVFIADAPKSGELVFILYQSANEFGDFRDPVRTERKKADGRNLFSLTGVAPGEYALMVYYDENNNGIMDKNFIGIPREPLGYSNNYEPKGPPSFSRAVFKVQESKLERHDIKLRRPLGKRGRVGAGVGVIARSTPYKDYHAAVYQFIPAITYTGNRVQLYGPYARLSILGSHDFRLAATARYRIGVYEEDESDYFKGMGDAESTAMAGLAVQSEFPGGVDVSLNYSIDALDRIGGSEGAVEIDKSWAFGIMRITPSVALNWQSSKMANADFGVPENKATLDRPAYKLDDIVTVEAGLGVFLEISSDWLLFVNASIEYLDNDITDSPLVTADSVVKGFGAISYLF